MTENQEGPGRKRRSGEEIKRLVLEFEASGLRQYEFCRNHGLALSTLQRQLKKRRLNKSEAKEGGRFVAVKLAGLEARGQKMHGFDAPLDAIRASTARVSWLISLATDGIGASVAAPLGPILL